jgi:hypothetical protein
MDSWTLPVPMALQTVKVLKVVARAYDAILIDTAAFLVLIPSKVNEATPKEPYAPTHMYKALPSRWTKPSPAMW